MKYISLIAIIVWLASCSDSFINHELKAERIGECTQQRNAVKMISNINGERYEFEYCLEENYNGKDYKVERKGDSLVVSFPVATTKAAKYKLTLDIDAKPTYHHILLGDKLIEVSLIER